MDTGVPPDSPPTNQAVEPRMARPACDTGTWRRPAVIMLAVAGSNAQMVETVDVAGVDETVGAYAGGPDPSATPVLVAEVVAAPGEEVLLDWPRSVASVVLLALLPFPGTVAAVAVALVAPEPGLAPGGGGPSCVVPTPAVIG